MKQRYSTYKSSGVEWIGEIPSHWKTSLYKYNITILSGFPFKSELFDKEEGFPLMRIRDITSGTVETFYKGDFDENYVIKKGDIVIGMDGEFNVRQWDNIDILLNQRCCKVQDVKGINRRFIYYTLPFDLKIINDLTYYTTVKHLSVDDIKNIHCVIPPIDEQEQIVKYLDEKTSQVDGLISITEKKIELLKQKRTSLINEVVTKGLNKDVELKDSGVEWIGEIPSHWDVKRIKHLTEVSVGLVINPSTYFDDEGTIPIITGKNVTINGMDLRNVDYITVSSNELLRQTQIYTGDVVSMRVGYPGRSCVVSERDNGINCCSLIITRRSEKINSFFLNYLLNTTIGKVQVELTQGGMGQQVVNLGSWKEFLLPYPNISEQEQIVEYIDTHTTEIDKLVSIEKRRIETLKEYRQSLISEVVTGKIKVTNN
jgi:type I restriction enzyme, S subunit